MNSRHARTLAAIFTEPAPAALEWAAIEALPRAVGCNMVEGSGSRVRFVYEGRVATFHRPHPQKEAKRYQVRDARAFLVLIGVTP
jgi:hypothetical protein